uniref:Cadherin domain-containing protein n=1 Tax=Oncorhynchus tshawytscha TaxID=74940 RepID=A0AAZ3NMA9_ONCTS
MDWKLRYTDLEKHNASNTLSLYLFSLSPPLKNMGCAQSLTIKYNSVLVSVAVVEARHSAGLRRHKREWIIPPQKLDENVDYTKKEFIAKIRSDSDDGTGNVQYSLTGVGASKPPYHLFRVNPDTGFVFITGILDRETIAMYNLSGTAMFLDGSEAEKNIDLRIQVVDQNDNPPIFGDINPGEVYELSPTGTSIMTLTATDADEPGNENSKIAYTIIKQEPPGESMFHITKDGVLKVKQPTLDREVQDWYMLTVKGTDLDGRPEGNTGTGTFRVNIKDVNDHPPTLEKDEYEGSIEENTENVEVMRFKAEDMDMENTPNWAAQFEIVKGNEAGYFSIETDPKTNEGVLILKKSVDYEDVKHLELGIAVANQAPPYNGSTGKPMKTYPVKIAVKNQPEGPRFDPKVKAIPISEGGDFNINKVIGSYHAIDGDTLMPAQNVRYAKGSDPDNWLTVDELTGDIKLNKMPDRESKFLVNGTYYAKVLCMTQDMPSKTATGMVAIQVEDLNDHCPMLTSKVQTMCMTADAITVTAVDKDAFPNGAPFTFTIIPEGTEGVWVVEHLNDTSTILRSQKDLWPGSYAVAMEIRDQQGHTCPDLQKLKVDVCTCADKGKACATRGVKGSTGAVLGPAAIGLLFLGLLTLLLIPLLLLFCTCGGAGGLPGGFTEMPFDAKSQLISYHTEGQGENTVRRGKKGVCACGVTDNLLSENHVQKDSMLVYDYEGQGSPVGSVGCCSLLESDNDLQFLNDLGPKFKTLAEVCRGERFQTEVSAPLPPRPIISMPTAASSVTTNVASRLVSAASVPLVQGGQVLQGGQAWLQQSSSLQQGGLSGSQSMLVMEGQGGISGGSGVQKGQGGVLGFSQGSMQRNGLSGSHRVLYTTEQSSAAESSAGSQSGIVELNGFSSKVRVGPASSSRKAVIEKRVVTNQSTSK